MTTSKAGGLKAKAARLSFSFTRACSTSLSTWSLAGYCASTPRRRRHAAGCRRLRTEAAREGRDRQSGVALRAENAAFVFQRGRIDGDDHMRRVDAEIRQHVLVENCPQKPIPLVELAKRLRVGAQRAVPSKQGVMAPAAERRIGSCRIMPAAQLAKPTSLMPMSIRSASAERLKTLFGPQRMTARRSAGPAAA